jgi:hypothetical protein
VVFLEKRRWMKIHLPHSLAVGDFVAGILCLRYVFFYSVTRSPDIERVSPDRVLVSPQLERVAPQNEAVSPT